TIKIAIYIDGDLYSFDGLADRDGKPVFYTSHFFSTGIMHSVNESHDLFYYSLRDIPEDLKDAGLKTLKAFNARETFFHLEYFRTKKDKKIVALEVNMRPPGALTTDMFNFANDIDIYQEWANVVVNNRFDSKYDRKYHCCYIGRKYVNNYKHSRQEIFEKYGKYIVADTVIPDVFSAAIGNYAYIARHQDLNKILEIAKFILS
ncbi:MAG: carboxylate--amine ligase, partial [bacterium]